MTRHVGKRVIDKQPGSEESIEATDVKEHREQVRITANSPETAVAAGGVDNGTEGSAPQETNEATKSAEDGTEPPETKQAGEEDPDEEPRKAEPPTQAEVEEKVAGELHAHLRHKGWEASIGQAQQIVELVRDGLSSAPE